MSAVSYRAEVDGLRALAVVGVLLYHAGLGCPGGYVGVDVFFVISGYLITSLILKDLGAGPFSVPQFWMRRIRRIMPALTAMVCMTLLAGSLLLEPDAFARLAREAVAQSLGLSNVHFLRDIGYFAENAEVKPLLHTWSLAVEEQFYLVFPLILVPIVLFLKKRTLHVLSGILLASFALSLYGMRHRPDAAFYLLPARAWELMAGAVIAVSQERFSIRGRRAEWMSGAGLALILTAMFAFTGSTPFPGMAALLPVAGTALIIAGCKDSPTLVGRFFSLKPIVFIGLISYSLYLWHWPLLVFARLTLVHVTPLVKTAVLGLSFILAALSWKYIELPFRNRSLLKSRPAVFAFALAATLVMTLSGLWIVRSEGFPARLTKTQQLMAEDIAWNGSALKSKKRGVPMGATKQAADGQARYDFAFLGDSHGLVITELVQSLAARHNLSGLAFLRKGTPPVTDLFTARSNPADFQKIRAESTAIIDEIISRKIGHVILVGRWSAMCDGLNASEIADAPRADPHGPMVVETPESSVTHEQSAQALRRQLGHMVDRFEKSGITVWILKQVPEADRSHIARHFYLSKRFPLVNHLDSASTTRAEHRARQAHANAALDSVGADRIHVIDPAPYFFPEGRPLTLYAERAYYRDEHHLTRYGAEIFLTPVFDGIFSRIAMAAPGS